MVNFESPYYPYEKIQTWTNTLVGAEDIPHQLIMYLLDLPDSSGYVPIDDNSRPRVRLAKYLWYDESDPLAQPLPTQEQKLSMLYNGKNATLSTQEDRIKHPKGYRIMAQNYTRPSELEARVMLKCYMARVIPKEGNRTMLGIDFETSVNYALDNIMKGYTYSRMYAIFQCLVEALHGVNISGIGTVYFDKRMHGDCGYTLYHTEGDDLYSDTFMAIEWQETAPPEIVQSYNYY